ncbi:hypothetical protein [Immundisolibacter sp.]
MDYPPHGRSCFSAALITRLAAAGFRVIDQQTRPRLSKSTSTDKWGAKSGMPAL